MVEHFIIITLSIAADLLIYICYFISDGVKKSLYFLSQRFLMLFLVAEVSRLH